jgi:UDP-N-acetylmuramate--alanine ligase
MADVERAFLDFIDRVPFYGAATACIDNALLKGILPRVRRRVFTYGVAEEADYRLEIVESTQTPNSEPGLGSTYSRFQVHTAAGTLGPFELHVPGQHNVLNATAAVAIARQLDVAPEKIAEGLANFRGVDRRFQQRGTARGVAVVDDYGHHPTEIRATLAAARECSRGRVHVVFQPHRYSRTADLMDEFSIAFTGADTVIVLPIYAASEEPIPGVTAERLAERIQAARVEFAAEFAIAVSAVAASAREGDLILTLGAGSVSQLAPQILAALEALPSQ